MKSIDDFSRPEEYISPMDKHFRSAVRAWVDKDVLPHRRRFDEDWKEHALIEPAFDSLMANKGLGIQKDLECQRAQDFDYNTKHLQCNCNTDFHHNLWRL